MESSVSDSWAASHCFSNKWCFQSQVPRTLVSVDIRLSILQPSFFPQCCSSLGFIFRHSKHGFHLVLSLAVPSGRNLLPSLLFSLFVILVSRNATYPEKQKQHPCVPLTLGVLRTGLVIARGSPHLSASHHTYMCHKGGAWLGLLTTVFPARPPTVVN